MHGLQIALLEFRMRKSLCYPFLATVLVALSGAAFAFGRAGHETVGYIAASMIVGTNAEKAVNALLNDGETLATAAEWPDCAKGFQYCGKKPTPEMIQFAQRNPNHHNYHYTDLPFQLTQYEDGAVGATKDDVIHALADAIRTLKDQAPLDPAHDFTKREALFILAHMVGDIHQPLHVGAAYVDEHLEFIVPETKEQEDQGFTQGGNLLCHGAKGVHSVWDSNFVNAAMKAADVTSSEDFAGLLLAKAKKVKVDTGAAATWPRKWATETLLLANQEISGLTVTDHMLQGAKSVCQKTGDRGTGSAWTIDFPENYSAQGAVTVSKQLAKAGARLARLLKALFP